MAVNEAYYGSKRDLFILQKSPTRVIWRDNVAVKETYFTIKEPYLHGKQ